MTKIVVGLGNHGREYQNTRHNTGRIVVEAISKKVDEKVKSVKYILPDTFMNNSGSAVAKALAGKKALKDLIIIYDDIDIPIGRMKISFNRSSGGHKGLESIIKAIKSEEFLRIRIGICPTTSTGKMKKPKNKDAVIKFILGEFKKPELDQLKKISKKVTEAVICIYTEGKDKAMSLYN